MGNVSNEFALENKTILKMYLNKNPVLYDAKSC